MDKKFLKRLEYLEDLQSRRSSAFTVFIFCFCGLLCISLITFVCFSLVDLGNLRTCEEKFGDDWADCRWGVD